MKWGGRMTSGITNGGITGERCILNYCCRFTHLVEMIESDSDEATTEVISHTEGLEALGRALLYVEQHSKATPTDMIFMKRWRDIAAVLVVQHFIRRK
jgi:hypothetical protein